MKRRSFLQRIGWGLAAWGGSQVGLWQLGDRYRQVLAEPSPRKLALLVGINQYSRGPGLNGCLTDVELQRELLLYRFGFQNSDILTLTDQQATRENIEAAFVSHLIEQARPGDAIVFHFSGYGSSIGSGTAPDTVQHTLVPVDGIPAADATEVNDLLEETLLLLLRSLPTDRITTILDTSYTPLLSTDGPILGNLRLRSRPTPPEGTPCPAELAFQEQLLSRVNASLSQTRVERRSGQMPGVVLAAARELPAPQKVTEGDKAFEARWHGFSSGLFTYALTQSLWNTTPANTLQIHFSRTATLVEQWVGKEQQPSLMGQKSREQTLSPYYLAVEPELGAEGVITAIEDDGKTGRLWLAGVPGNVLDYYGANSIMVVVDHPGPDSDSPSPFPLQVLSRNGLAAKARSAAKGEAPEKFQVGQWVQEWVRVLPRQVNLLVALDSSLERIERVDATSAFSGIAQVRSVTAGEQPADCLLGRVSPPPPVAGNPTPQSAEPFPSPAEGAASSPDAPSLLPSNRYALFSVGHELIPNTIGPSGEAVKVAIQRLVPSLRSLQATKLLRLTVNEGSSRLAVGAVLEVVAPESQQVMQRSTVRGMGIPPEASNPANGKPIRETGVVSLPIGSRIRYRLQNYGDRPVYFVLFGLDTSGSAIALYSGQAANSAANPDARSTLKQEEIAPGETLTIPQASNSFEWVVREPVGIAETLILFSTVPFTQTLTTLESGLRQISNSQRIGVPSNPVEVAQAVLADLHQASSGLPLTPMVTADSLALHMNAWATLSFVYQVV